MTVRSLSSPICWLLTSSFQCPFTMAVLVFVTTIVVSIFLTATFRVYLPGLALLKTESLWMPQWPLVTWSTPTSRLVHGQWIRQPVNEHFVRHSVGPFCREWGLNNMYQGLVQSDKEDNVPDDDWHTQQQHESSRKEKDSARVELLGVKKRTHCVQTTTVTMESRFRGRCRRRRGRNRSTCRTFIINHHLR